MDTQELESAIKQIKNDIVDIRKSSDNRLTFSSSPDEKTNARDAVYEDLSNYFFDRIRFISFPFTEVTSDHTNYYQSTVSFGGASRLTDTAEGKYLNPERVSRMRCSFYVRNPDALIGYILSPVSYDSFTSLNTFASMDILRAYVGIKFNLGEILVAVKEYGGDEKTYSTGLSFTGSGDTSTWLLEIKYFVGYTEIYINSTFVGIYKTSFGITQTNYTYLPLLSPAKSSDGTGVNITVENYQFIQDN